MPNEIKYYFISFLIAFLLLGLFIILLATLYSKKQKKNKIEKQMMQAQFQQSLLQTQIEIQEQTFKNISQEIHDNIGQVLTLAKLHLNTFPQNIGTALQARVSDTEQLVSKAINDLRDLSKSLHSDKISEIGLANAIENELRMLRNTKQFHTSLDTVGQPFQLLPNHQMILFRIVQESLNNAIKHAKAKSITVQLHYQNSQLCLSIADDGIGFNTNALQTSQTGIGLKNMQDRAALIGGVFTLFSMPGNGTTVTININETQAIEHIKTTNNL